MHPAPYISEWLRVAPLNVLMDIFSLIMYNLIERRNLVMQNTSLCDKEQLIQQLALFKFSIIAPVVNKTHDFKSDMEYFRNAALKQYSLPNGKTATFSHLTIKNWYIKYCKYGFNALIPKGRADFGSSRALPIKAHNRIFELKAEYPHITGKAIYKKLIQEGTINAKDASISSVYRFLRSNELKSIPSVERKAFEMEHANDCWQCDTSHGPIITIEDKKVQTYLIQIIDDASRLIVGHEFFLNDNSLNLQFVLKQAVKIYGIPKKIFVDNGKPYQNLQFKIICANLGSVLIYAKPYSPQSKRKD